MSTYGKIHDEIQRVRGALARELGCEAKDLDRLSDGIGWVASKQRQFSGLLVDWATLEEKAARCDPKTGEPR